MKNPLEIVFTHKKIVLLFCLWTASISLTIIQNLWFSFNRSGYMKRLFWFAGGPMFGWKELLFLLVVSFLIGMFLSEPTPLIYSYIGSIFLSFAIGVTYNYLWNWSVFGQLLSSTPFGWEYGLFAAILNVFRILFPFGALVSLFGAVVGLTLRALLNL